MNTFISGEQNANQEILKTIEISVREYKLYLIKEKNIINLHTRT